MKAPWQIKTDDTREENSKYTFIIFCEDGAVEPAYFKSFRADNIKISAFGNKKQHHAQVDFATEYFRQNDLIEVVEGKEVLKIDEGAQVWCVFDRDKEDNDQKDTAFNDSIANGLSKGIKMAWSNDDFELWILLHFEDVNPQDEDYKHRTKYYERLTAILKSMQPITQEERRVVQNPNFDYYTAMKGKKKFISITYQQMKDNLQIAIDRAIQLEEYYDTKTTTPHLQCPCTKVHHLVMELIRIKELKI